MLENPLKNIRLLRLYGLSDGVGDKYLILVKLICVVHQEF